MGPLVLSVLLAGAFAADLSPSDIAALRQPGTPVPAAALPNLAGGTLSLRSPDGKATVLVVFASWCDPCRENMPAIVKFARKSSARVVGIDELESASSAKALVAQYKVPFPTVLLSAPGFDAPGVTDEQRGATGIDIPAVYFIDAHGRSVNAVVGADAVRSWLKSPHPLE